jgi:hypothetical protein
MINEEFKTLLFTTDTDALYQLGWMAYRIFGVCFLLKLTVEKKKITGLFNGYGNILFFVTEVT